MCEPGEAREREREEGESEAGVATSSLPAFLYLKLPYTVVQRSVFLRSLAVSH